MKIFACTLLCGMTMLCCSCSTIGGWFGKKPPEILSQGQSPNVNITVPTDRITDIAKVESSKIFFKKDELTFQVKADSQLNRFQNNAHALFMCIFQLKDPNAFNQLTEEKDGLSKLLECNRFDSSVANSKRIIMQPGQEITDIRDRAEGARFIGLATGYYGAEKVRATHLITMPVRLDGSSGSQITIDLGAFEIENVTVK